MKCSNCGYKADCPCEFDNGLCWTCRFGGKKSVIKIAENYCNQTMEALINIKAKVFEQPNTKLRKSQLIILNSQIKQFDANPCRFKTFIDNILLN